VSSSGYCLWGASAWVPNGVSFSAYGGDNAFGTNFSLNLRIRFLSCSLVISVVW
jgi:hypothetical protein